MSTIIECIRTVGRGERGRKPLTFDQAYQVMDDYLNGRCDDDQMAMLMMLIRVQNETQAEIAGFVKAFQQRVPAIGADIDWPCYAGKRASAGQPWHLLAARILADNGYRIVMHGYHEAGSEREHVESYLEQFAVPVANNADHARQLLADHLLVYLPLAHFAPQAETMIGWKARYGLRSPINTVVRALNPGGARLGVRGSFHPSFQQLHAEIESQVGQHSESVISFKGVSGESEYNPKVSQTVWLSHQGKVRSLYWEERMSDELPLPEIYPFGGDEAERLLMANGVVTTMAAVLFAELLDEEQAYQQACRYWADYVAQ